MATGNGTKSEDPDLTGKPPVLQSGEVRKVKMAIIGQVEAFDESSSDWESYEERLTAFIRANQIPETSRVDAFLSIIGPKTYKLLKSLLAPESPTTKSLEDLQKVLREHLSPRPSVIAERAKFHKRVQQENESISDFVAELKRLAETCKFGNNLQEALRDRLVCGLLRLDIQKALFTEDESLTFKKATEKALSLEMATKNATECHANNVTQPVIQTLTHTARKKPSKKQNCYRCGSDKHISSACTFKSAVCFSCNKTGHIKDVCRSRNNGPPPAQGAQRPTEKKRFHFRRTQPFKAMAEVVDIEPPLWRLDRPHKDEPISFTVNVQNVPLNMELDTGAAVSVISQQDYQSCFPELQLCPTSVTLRTYTGQCVRPKGVINVEVQHHGQKCCLPLYVLTQQGPPLIGRNWLRDLRLDWSTLHYMRQDGKGLADLLEKYAQIFTDELGEIQGEQATLILKEGAVPKFMKARSIPFALKPAVEKELEKLEKLGVIESVTSSRYASPIVPVVKTDGSIRLCGDYKASLNPCLETEVYPLPKIDEMLAALAGGKRFSKIDLSQAYQQVVVDEQSSQYLTLNTHKGLYRVKRLAFGISSAPSIFQRVMDNMLKDLEGVICYLDDILVTGSNEKDHLQNLERVLQRLDERGVRIKRKKCDFFKQELRFLGHVISDRGISTAPDKVNAILYAPAPKDKKQLKSFIGLVTYYTKFLADLSTVMHPLNNLLCKNAPYAWSSQCESAFVKVKQMLAAAPILAHYDPTMPLEVGCDASSYGLGAVLSVIQKDGTRKPVAYASRSLTHSETRYSQLEREGLALVFAVKKFHYYIYGRKFHLVTDHKPLEVIFGPKNGIPTNAAARLQRWAITLSAYNYSLVYRQGQTNFEADCLSRLPLPYRPSTTEGDDVDTFYSLRWESFPVNSSDIARATAKDSILSAVLKYVLSGWPPTLSREDIKPYWSRKNELSEIRGCILWGMRIVIPTFLRTTVLQELHEGHPGIVRMKEISRSYVWWPRIDVDIEAVVKGCPACQQGRALPTPAPLHPWAWPTRPWSRLHIDFAGPFQQRYFFVVVDAHSKWPEVFIMTSTSTELTIAKLRDIFSRFGLPEVLVSDNGPQFASKLFQDFVKQNGIKHIRSAPYHPSSNGQEERFVRTMKEAIRKDHACRPLEARLNSFLLAYRNTPQASTQQSPAALLLGRPLRTRLDLLRPDSEATVRYHQFKGSQRRRMKDRQFAVGANVLVKNFREGPKWLMARVLSRSGPVSYLLQVNSPRGPQLWKRHIDHIHARSTASEADDHPEEQDKEIVLVASNSGNNAASCSPPVEELSSQVSLLSL
ncbi:uncharacterized protein K02A2.6-like [Ornithodoros turicata]|uniref:uncharacterized protein K02A2.6-like n=1 Tax=Ornithodoros turicata TaxID=34597 RepID=UPI003138C71A